MYPSCFREDMPCGRGFEWEENNGHFIKKLMTNQKISLVSIQWLGHMESDERFINRDGRRCKIITGWNSEEVKVGKYSLDGYCEVDGRKYALEFDGCRWHGCDRCGQPPENYENIVRKPKYNNLLQYITILLYCTLIQYMRIYYHILILHINTIYENILPYSYIEN